MWRTVIYLGLSFSAVLAIPVGEKNIPIIPDDTNEIVRTRSEIAMSTLNLPSNATSIRADIVDGFTCSNKTYGYYADVENDCQIFHVCLPVVYPDGKENTFRWSFICPEETLFSQESFTCVRSEDMNFGCDESERFYELNRNFGSYADTSMEVSSIEADLNSNMNELLRKTPLETQENENKKPLQESYIKSDQLEVQSTTKNVVEIKKEQLPQQTTQNFKKKTTIARTTSNRFVTQPTKRTTVQPVTSTTITTVKYQRKPTTPKLEKVTQKPSTTEIKADKKHERTTMKPLLIKENNKNVKNDLKKIEIPLNSILVGQEVQIPVAVLKSSNEAFDSNKINKLPEAAQKTNENLNLNEMTLKNSLENQIETKKQSAPINDEQKVENNFEEKILPTTTTSTNLNDESTSLKHSQANAPQTPFVENAEVIKTEETKNRLEVPIIAEIIPGINIHTPSETDLNSILPNEENKNDESVVESGPEEIVIKTNNDEKTLNKINPSNQVSVSSEISQDTSYVQNENFKDTKQETENKTPDQQDLIIKAIADLINQETSKLSSELDKAEQPEGTNSDNQPPQAESFQTISPLSIFNLLPTKEDLKIDDTKETILNGGTEEKEVVKVEKENELQKISDDLKESSATFNDELKETSNIKNEEKDEINKTEVKKTDDTHIIPESQEKLPVEVVEKLESGLKTEEVNLDQKDEISLENDLLHSEFSTENDVAKSTLDTVKPTEVTHFTIETNLALEKNDKTTEVKETSEIENENSEKIEKKNEQLKLSDSEKNENNNESELNDIRPIFHRVRDPIVNFLKSETLEITDNSEPKVKEVKQTEQPEGSPEFSAENTKSDFSNYQTEFQSSEANNQAHEELLSSKHDGELQKSENVEKAQASHNEGQKENNREISETVEKLQKTDTIERESDNALHSSNFENPIEENFPESQISLLLGEAPLLSSSVSRSQKNSAPPSTHELTDLLKDSKSTESTSSQRHDESTKISTGKILTSRTEMARNLRNKMDPRKRRFLFRSESS